MGVREGNEQSSFISTWLFSDLRPARKQRPKGKNEIFFRTRAVFAKADIRVRCAFNERCKTIGC